MKPPLFICTQGRTCKPILHACKGLRRILPAFYQLFTMFVPLRNPEKVVLCHCRKASDAGTRSGAFSIVKNKRRKTSWKKLAF